MGVQKKHGKGRLDKWYRLAKEKGYRARAAFKLIQLNRKYGFLEKSKVLLDLCAAPGSWCQVAAEVMPAGSLIVGVDLAPIKPIPRAITFQSDITTDKCRATIRSHLKTWKADTVLHDGAPNVGVAWVQDAYSQAELVLESLKLAVEFLVPGGTFVTKVFRSKDYNALIWIFNQLFDRVEATKPPSSRNVSAEIFVVCREFKAPKKIDPRLLDSRSVFAEIASGKENNEAKVFNPEKKTRKREGYEEGDYIQFKEVSAGVFISTTDPIDLLGTMNKFHFRNSDSEAENAVVQVLERLDDTTEEIKACCEDLKVLSRKDFRALLRWRLKAREVLGFTTSKSQAEPQDEQAEIAPLDEEMETLKEMQTVERAMTAKKKKERRRENERKRKEIIRMQLHMQTPMEIGIEHGSSSVGDSIFSLKTADSANATGTLSKGRMPAPVVREKSPSPELELSSDEDGDKLETELDELYEQYQQQREENSKKFRARKNRKLHEKDEWHGFDSDSQAESVENEENLESSSDSGLEEPSNYRPLQFQGVAFDERSSLSKGAQAFFGQDIFKDIDGLDAVVGSDSGIELDDVKTTTSTSQNGELSIIATTEKALSPFSATASHRSRALNEDDGSSCESEDDTVEGIPSTAREQNDMQVDTGHDMDPNWDSEPQNIEIITAEAMDLARQLASGQKRSSDLVDDGFNKLAFRDREGLPQWFLDDEGSHSKVLRPVSAAAAAAIKEKMRLLNARPIKKVQEAKARKKFRAARRLEKLRKKSALLAEEEGVSEKDKAANIMKMMSRAAKKQPRRKVQLVVARGPNRGVSGRPRGVKGRYKVVDARLKKDTKALKRLAKKKK